MSSRAWFFMSSIWQHYYELHVVIRHWHPFAWLGHEWCAIRSRCGNITAREAQIRVERQRTDLGSSALERHVSTVFRNQIRDTYKLGQQSTARNTHSASHEKKDRRTSASGGKYLERCYPLTWRIPLLCLVKWWHLLALFKVPQMYWIVTTVAFCTIPGSYPL